MDEFTGETKSGPRSTTSIHFLFYLVQRCESMNIGGVRISFLFTESNIYFVLTNSQP